MGKGVFDLGSYEEKEAYFQKVLSDVKQHIYRYTGSAERYFLFGIKKVVLSSPAWSRFQILKKQFPYISNHDFPALLEDQFIFFQDEQLKERLCNKYLEGTVSYGTSEYHYILGSLLGFPPNAVHFFSTGKADQEPKKRITIRFCGVECVGSVEDLVNDVIWLWENYPYPDMDILTLNYNCECADIQYGDISRVIDVQKRILSHISAV